MWAHLKDDDSVRPHSNSDAQHHCSHHGRSGVGSQVQQIWGVEVLTAASAILTLAVLFPSEIIPKHWALPTGSGYQRRRHIFSHGSPKRSFSDWPYQFIKSVLPKSKNAMVTRDDVAAMADLGETGA